MRHLRAAGQWLHRPAGATAADVVRHLLAVQAQDARSARLALRARLGRAPEDDEALVVTWLMRTTLHLVHVDDLPWLHAITAPTSVAASTRRLAALGLEAGDVEAGVAAIAAALPFSRAEAGEVLGGRTGQAVPHLLLRASLQGVCVHDLDGRFRAVSLPAVDRSRALDELARRYAAAHPGATSEDLAAWAGLPKRDVRPMPDTARVDDADVPVPPRLLPAFDPLVLGWRDKGWLVPDALRARVLPGGGMFRATAVDDGRAVGTWTAPGGRVVLEPADLAPAFAEEVAGVEAMLRRR